VAAIRAAATAEPGDRELQLTLARWLLWSGRSGEAAPVLDAWLQRRPEDVEAFTLRARVKALTGDRGGARRDFERVLAERPGNSDALFGLAQLDSWEGRRESARARFQALLERDAYVEESRTALAYMDLWDRRYAKARTSTRELSAQYPDSSAVKDLRLALQRATRPELTVARDIITDTDATRLETTRYLIAGAMGNGDAWQVSATDYDLRSGARTGRQQEVSLRYDWIDGDLQRLRLRAGYASAKPPGSPDRGMASGGMSWSRALGSRTRIGLSAGSDPLVYTVRLLETGIQNRSLTATGSWAWTADRSVEVEGSRWDTSDGNARMAFTADVLQRGEWGEHRWRLRGRLRWFDWSQDFSNGYYDAQDYRSAGLQAGLSGPLGNSRLRYALEGETGLRRSRTLDRPASTDPGGSWSAELNWQVTRAVAVTAFYDGGTSASEAAEPWRYSRYGVRLGLQTGLGR
jgi:Flp pilus assembly protein TadD